MKTIEDLAREFTAAACDVDLGPIPPDAIKSLLARAWIAGSVHGVKFYKQANWPRDMYCSGCGQLARETHPPESGTVRLVGK
jgi:hypothetical protein